MLDAAREALSFAEGRSRADLARDRMLALSLIGEIPIIGEAATKVSPDLRRSVTSIRWGDVIGMRRRFWRRSRRKVRTARPQSIN